MSGTEALDKYLQEISAQFYSGHAREHAYRPALERLMSSFEDVRAVNDPARSENGNPDFVFLKSSNKDLILGYAEAKDITINLDKTLKTEQLRRYAGYEKLFLTNYLDFVFLQNGEEYERISIGKLVSGQIKVDSNQYLRLINELTSFLEKSPEKIRSGKKLSLIMGGKARRIRDNVREYLKSEGLEKNAELEKIFALMKEMLVHDLTKEKFADMYAQTLVYGLFTARYNDKTPDDFSRREAVENVPKSNPFLRKFFDHIAGSDFDSRLAHIVDELCDVFRVSDVDTLVHKHLRLFELENEKDPIIHFYEDFLKEYDPEERKRMGAYYTPVPVVQFIIREVDRILKEDFGLAKGLVDQSKITKEIDHGQELQVLDKNTGRHKRTTKELREFHQVQILDPAVGTATFLNETIKYIRKSFIGQEGQWSAYVNEHLLDRLHGFELMMAPYTVAHLKLGITLQETGVKDISKRLGIYLTNTLEEGVPRQQDLFTAFGLAGAVTDESQKASEIKHERPVMVVMGNPPYSGESSNKTQFADSLIDKYRVEPGGMQKLQEQTSKWLGDDYVKFISFAEDMIIKNGRGIMAYITNNGYLDNPTFRGMRWHLAKTFDKIYILDLHGSIKKKEVSADGSKDVNVFDIQQGVSIILAVKTGANESEQAEIYHSDLYGSRQYKFNQIAGRINFSRLSSNSNNIYFVPRNTTNEDEYLQHIALSDLFVTGGVGITTAHDNFVVDVSKHDLINKFNEFKAEVADRDLLHEKFKVKKKTGWDILDGWKNLQRVNPADLVQNIAYRPFDNRNILYEDKLVWRTVRKVMNNYLDGGNIGLAITRQFKTGDIYRHALIHEYMIESSFVSNRTSEVGSTYPLFIRDEHGKSRPNFSAKELSRLTSNLTFNPSPEDILDYIYTVLYSPSYRQKYKEFLKTDFPRIPVPSQAEFDRMVPLGHELRELHLMKSPLLNDYPTTFSVPGDNIVSEVKWVGKEVSIGQAGKPDSKDKAFEENAVYINKTQYFGNVPKIAWEFYIGGYQPAQKWLKDRKGQKLSSDDIEHYQKIITVLAETDRIMKQIDKTWKP